MPISAGLGLISSEWEKNLSHFNAYQALPPAYWWDISPSQAIELQPQSNEMPHRLAK
jgi:hypothetical protein